MHNTTEVLALVRAERARQDRIYGDQTSNSAVRFLAALGEEFGEVSRAMWEIDMATSTDEKLKHLANLRAELVQVAATAVMWRETLG